MGTWQELFQTISCISSIHGGQMCRNDLLRNVINIAQGAPQEYDVQEVRVSWVQGCTGTTFLAKFSTSLRAQLFLIFVIANMLGD